MANEKIKSFSSDIYYGVKSLDDEAQVIANQRAREVELTAASSLVSDGGLGSLDRSLDRGEVRSKARRAIGVARVVRDETKLQLALAELKYKFDRPL